MGFVIPKEVTKQRIPEPSGDNVEIRKRSGGRFAVYRFSGRIEGDLFALAEKQLRNWMTDRGLIAGGKC